MMRRRRSTTGMAMLLAAAAAGCGTTVDEPATSTEQQFSINQTNLLLVVGDSTVLTIIPVPLEPAVDGTVRWTSSQPNIVSVDSLVIIGEPAKVRARASGSAVLTGVIKAPGRTITAGVTVRVGAG